MFNAAILEVLFGLSLTFFFFSIVCSALAELISSIFNFRGQILSASLEQMLGKQTKEAVYKHPLVFSFHGRSLGRYCQLFDWLEPRLPAYIPSRMFALALIDVLTEAFGNTTAIEADKLQDNIDSELRKSIALDTPKSLLGHSGMNDRSGVSRGVIGILANSGLSASLSGEQVAGAEGEAAVAAAAVANTDTGSPPAPVDAIPAVAATIAWYNDAMERAIGAYKRRTLLIIVIVASLICCTAKLDTARLANYLWTDDIRRAGYADVQKSVLETAAADAQTHLTEAKTAQTKTMAAVKTAQLRVAAPDVKSHPDKLASAKKSLADAQAADVAAKAVVTAMTASVPQQTDAARRALADINAVGASEAPFPFTAPIGTPLPNKTSGTKGMQQTEQKPNVSFWETLRQYIDFTPGIFFSILAISLGSPFWFDILSRVANLRGTGRISASKTDVPAK